MKPICTYNVLPRIPERLRRLDEIARCFWFDWHHDALALFLRIDLDLWETTGHNPARMLGLTSQERLNELAEDEGYVALYDRVCRDWDTYRVQPIWKKEGVSWPENVRIAYFSLEFGVSECLPIYSGGLGVLSGDHVKSAGDLGLPLVGVGLLYQQGYFRQYLNTDGWQGERYPDNDFFTMPITLVRQGDGLPLTIAVDYPGGPVHAQLWRVTVGRSQLVMLDTNIPQNNRPDDRSLTYQLYGGNIQNRIRQEILLGVGGLKALDALNMRPTICHLNEGHSAFLSLERIRRRMSEDGLTFAEAREATVAGNVFTTHTPVPAGNEIFPPHIVEEHVRTLLDGVDAPIDEILDLGRIHPGSHSEGFGMTVFAIRMSSHVNGVSKLHAHVSRDMWKELWPGATLADVPIEAITNGVHLPSWLARDMAVLFDRYLDPDWRDFSHNDPRWRRIQGIPDEELFSTHERRREKLVTFARAHLRKTLRGRRATPQELAEVDDILNPEALTIVFARRFATYKRGSLLLRDMDRLMRLIDNPDRPVQFIFAGKAHPHDTPGKKVIREIVHTSRNPKFRDHFIFLEDYDLQMARYLVQGADVWLNTPRRPLEASGTSGMKASLNGGLNVSILDGWYDEAHQDDPEIGWAIGNGEVYEDHEYQDQVECEALYNILEEQVAPMFYARSRDGIPHQWVGMMKSAMMTACEMYNTGRMVTQYAEQVYLPAARAARSFAANRNERAIALTNWKHALRERWGAVRVLDVICDQIGEIDVATEVNVRARIHLGELSPDEVLVEVYHGRIDPNDEIVSPRRIEMENTGPAHQDGADVAGDYLFLSHIPSDASGRYGYTVRVLPRHPDLVTPFVPGFITWAQ